MESSPPKHRTKLFLSVSAVGWLLVLLTLVGTLISGEVSPASRPAFFLYAGLVAFILLFRLSWAIFEKPPWIVGLYFFGQFAVFSGLHFAHLPYGFLWLLAMPVISQASGWTNWKFTSFAACAYISVMLFAYQGGHLRWSSSLNILLSIGSAFAFTIAFTRVAINALSAQQKSEELAAKLEATNAQLRAQAHQASELAAANERNRIARDIHDGLGHFLTVITVQLQAAQALALSQPDKAAAALEQAEALSRSALDEVRRSVGALRNAPPPPPLPAALQGLIKEFGLDVSLEIRGDPRPLPDAVERTFFRVVQEGLTNVHKHSGASSARVTLDLLNASRASVEIRDNGHGAVRSDHGYGLKGLRERLGAIHGTLVAENSHDGGFRLRAEAPL